MKNDKIEIKEKELENVTGGDVTSANIVGTISPQCKPLTGDVSLHNTTVEPVPLKPDKSEKDTLIPIPY